MTIYVLDTDIVTLLHRGDPVVLARVSAQAPGDVVTTAITVEEQLSGWYTYLRKAIRPAQVASGRIPDSSRASRTWQGCRC